jgi:hypothetical protein
VLKGKATNPAFLQWRDKAKETDERRIVLWDTGPALQWLKCSEISFYGNGSNRLSPQALCRLILGSHERACFY